MSRKKKVLVVTGGGDCPGLNAVIRAISKACATNGNWEAWGSIEAFNGMLADPVDIVKLTPARVAGIHVRGGTIIKTTNRGNPFDFPVKKKDGTWTTKNIAPSLVRKIKKLGFDAVINIGGDGSQKISLELHKLGLPIVGVPKTIDNDLSATDFTFGFNTAVQIATESFDKLVTTAESHHRVIIMEVMGRDAGWIALHTAIAGGAEICLIPEVPYDLDVVVKQINKRYSKGKGFVNIVIAEGAKAKNKKVVGIKSKDVGDTHIKLGGVGYTLRKDIENSKCEAQVRVTVLGHVQRGGTPTAFDRILASAFGVKAFELVDKGRFGKMVAYVNNDIKVVSLKQAVSNYNTIKRSHYLIKTARQMGISLGD